MNEFLQTQCKEVTKNIESLFETLSAVLDATHETYSTCDIRINERGDFAVVDADNKIVGSVSRDFNEMKIICAKFTTAMLSQHARVMLVIVNLQLKSMLRSKTRITSVRSDSGLQQYLMPRSFRNLHLR